MKCRRLGLLALLLVVSWTLAASAQGDGGDGARTLTLVSGNDTAPGRDPFTKFSGKIRLPKRCRSATLEIDVHADNDVTLSLNGVVFGAQPAGPLLPNFQGPPEHFTTNGPFRRRWNALELMVRDYGNPTALDYKATVTCKPDRQARRSHSSRLPPSARFCRLLR